MIKMSHVHLLLPNMVACFMHRPEIVRFPYTVARSSKGLEKGRE